MGLESPSDKDHLCLEDYKISVNIMDVSGERVLHAAALEGWERVMKVLSSQPDTDVHESDNLGQ
ncbi:hypothetical protein B9Z19DRAFT_1118595 [Tuber borchii]|uniref:Ankyrin repeat-containing domain protein n=1 Tax=Tuber borchii TaxID=42251 RepID=A0A2T7A836_TUBBO|nr:hypothetical protein B9Z19DRAFT_1118595 [Tuber borchii]